MTNKQDVVTQEQKEEPPETALQVIPGQDTSIMALLTDAVKDPDFDATKLELLIGLKERVDATEAKKAFIDAMYKFHENPPIIKKTKPVYGKDRYDKNGDINPNAKPHYHFAEFDDTVKAVRPALRKVGIIATWESKDLGGGITNVTCVLRHTMGHEERASMSGAPEAGGSKNALQGTGSSSSYLRKYTYLLVIGLVAEGEDDDGGGVKEWTGPLGVSALKKAARSFSTTLHKCLTMEDVNALVKSETPMLEQLEIDLEAWYLGDDNQDGAQAAIADRLDSLAAVTGEL